MNGKLHHSVATTVLAIGLLQLATTAAHAQGAAQQDAAQSDGITIGDIVVTATRRETSLQRTPQAISVVQGADQALKGQTQLEDLSASMPNVNFANTSNNSQFYVRGIGNTFLTPGGDPGVALYQDGAYVSDLTTTNVAFFDLERVEVLRGPQGALYGKNATGGAINMVSAAPESALGGQINAILGDYGRRDSEGYVTGPLGFADTDFRVSYQLRHHSGYTKNLLKGQPNAPDDLDDLDSQAIRIQTQTNFSTGGKLRIMFSHYSESDNGQALTVRPRPAIVYPVELLYGELPSDNPRKVYANVGYYDSDVNNINVNLEKPLGAVDLSFTGNYRTSDQRFGNDCDGTLINNCKYYRKNNSDDYYFDGHIASSGDSPFRWLVGATYSKFKINVINTVDFPFPLSYLTFDPADSTIAVPNIVEASGGSVNTESYAVYGDFRLKLSDIWALAGQVRYSKTTKKALETFVAPTFGVNVTGAPNRASNDFVPWKIGVEGQLTSDMLVYANYATAYKDGAINLGALQSNPVKPEKVQSLEAGFKTSFLDRKLQINGAVFHSNFSDLQISQLIGVVIVLTNVPKATITGGELEITARPFDGLTINASLGYVDTKLGHFQNDINVPGLVAATPIDRNGNLITDLKGNPLPYVSKWNGTVGLDYKFAAGSGYTASLGGDVVYRSRIYFNEFKDIYLPADNGTFVLDSDNSQKPVALLNLRGSFGPDSDAWKLFFYVNNVTNKLVKTGATIYSGLIGADRAVSYAPPRHFGIGASFTF